MSKILENIREKYPQYDDLTDAQLVGKVGDKFPQYLDDPDFGAEYAAAYQTTPDAQPDAQPVTPPDAQPEPVAPAAPAQAALTPEEMASVRAQAYRSVGAVPYGMQAVQAVKDQEMREKGGIALKSDDEIMGERIRAAQLTRDEMKAFGLPGWMAPIEQGVAEGVGGLASPENAVWAVGGAPVGKAFVAMIAGSVAKDAVTGTKDIIQGRTDEGLKKYATAATLVAPFGVAKGVDMVREAKAKARATAQEIAPTAPRTAEALDPNAPAEPSPVEGVNVEDLPPTPAPEDGTLPADSRIRARRNLTNKQIDTLLNEPAEVQEEFLKGVSPDEPVNARKFKGKLEGARAAAKPQIAVTPTPEAPAPTPVIGPVVTPTPPKDNTDSPLKNDLTKVTGDLTQSNEDMHNDFTAQTDAALGNVPKPEAGTRENVARVTGKYAWNHLDVNVEKRPDGTYSWLGSITLSKTGIGTHARETFPTKEAAAADAAQNLLEWLGRDEDKNATKTDIQKIAEIREKLNQLLAPEPEAPPATTEPAPNAKGVTDEQYQKMFAYLQKGSSQGTGIAEDIMPKAKPFFDAGKIMAWQQLKWLHETGKLDEGYTRPVYKFQIGDKVAFKGNFGITRGEVVELPTGELGVKAEDDRLIPLGDNWQANADVPDPVLSGPGPFPEAEYRKVIEYPDALPEETVKQAMDTIAKLRQQLADKNIDPADWRANQSEEKKHISFITGSLTRAARAQEWVNRKYKRGSAEKAASDLANAQRYIQEANDFLDGKAAAEPPEAKAEGVDTAPPVSDNTAEGKTDETGIQPADGSTPKLDVRQPTGTGEGTEPEGDTPGTPGQQGPRGGVGGAATDKGGNVGTGGAGRGKRGSSDTSGRTGADSGKPADADADEGTGSDNAEAGSGNRPGPAKQLTANDLNHVLPRDEDFIPSGAKTKARANLAAIELLKKLEAENRNPTPEEKAILAKYTGWGGIKQVFDEGKAAYRDRKYFYNPEQEREFKNWENTWGKLYDEVKAAMPEEDWNAAAKSVLNAHYTSREIINKIWDAVQRLGFNGGKALEPAGGVGHFVGLIPDALRGMTQWRAVELDNISGRMLAKLYPQAAVHQMGFQDARVPVNSQDLVISNVPFHKDGPIDKRYPRMSLHNYFFARGIDMLKPGGIMAAITSDSTMDNATTSLKAREYLAEKADLIGAIRLPNTAFKENAGTEVTTDILFFRKKDGTPFTGEPFVRTVPAETYKGEPIEINEYFAKHPEMMLGRMSKEGTMNRVDQQALLPTPGADLNRQLEEAVNRLPQIAPKAPGAYYTPQDVMETVKMAEKGTKTGQLIVRDGKIMHVQPDGTLEKPEWGDKGPKIAQAKRYIALRDHAKGYIDMMKDVNATDEDVEAGRATLNRLYNDYFAKHGTINGRSRFLADDVDYPLALALEDGKPRIVEQIVKGQTQLRTKLDYVKSPMFEKRTIFPRIPPAHVDTVSDGLQVSMNFTGKVDPAYIAKLTGKTEEVVKRTLRADGNAYENPETGLWEGSGQYLSGYVKDKLAAAREAAKDNPDLEGNVTALEKVQPKPVTIDQITAKLGAVWIPPETVENFVREKLGVKSKVLFTEATGQWHLEAGHGANEALNTTQYGITAEDPRHSWAGHDIVSSALNLKAPVVNKFESYIDDNGKARVRSVKDQKKTIEAEGKLDQIQKAFQEWVKSSPEETHKLEQLYNERYNGTIWPKFDAPNWDHYPGASNTITLRPHQKEVVTRMLQNSTMLAHAVGTGKTYAMITAAQEMRRLGLAKKPMIVVQNSTLEQFATKYKELYPTARVLVPNAKSREGEYRNATMSRIATGDWDAVIIPQSFVDMLPDDPIREKGYIDERVKEMKAALIEEAAASGKNSPKVKDIQAAIKRQEEKLAALQDRKHDNVLTFEQTGVDALFVDEAHAYKKLEFATKMDNVKGLDKGYSERGFSMFMKTRWVQERNQGRNVIFATGTPVSNTLAEAWNMMRYVRPDVLKQFGMESFDDFASTFGERRTETEMTAGGNWKPVTRFSKFVNGPELLNAWRTVADVVTADQIKLTDLPALKNGKPTAIVVPLSPRMKQYVEFLRSRLDAFAAMSGKDKRLNSHIPITTFTLAKKASLDMRMIDPTLPDEPGSKLNMAADQIKRVYDESTPVKGAQMVFSDLKQDAPKNPRFNVYNEVKKKLIERGIPEKEIAIITDDVKDAKREMLFKRVNDGDIRVVIGSSEKMGVGVNAQEHLIGLHHLDAPHRPMDIEQRVGRMVRQGNKNPTVEEFRYGIEQTLDAALFQKLAMKQKFINQILRGEILGRDFDDAANETSLNYEEQMAAYSGDPRAMEKVGLENQLRLLETQQTGHQQQVRESKSKIQAYEQRYIPESQRKLDASREAAADYEKTFGPGTDFALKDGKETIAGRKEISAYLEKRFQEAMKIASNTEGKKLVWGVDLTSPPLKVELNGKQLEFEARVPIDPKAQPDMDRAHIRWTMQDQLPRQITTGAGFFQSFAAMLQGIAREPADNAAMLEKDLRTVRQLKGFVEQPFDREGEIAPMKERLATIIAEFKKEGEKAPPKAPAADSTAEDGTDDDTDDTDDTEPTDETGTSSEYDAPVTYSHEQDVPGRGPTKFYNLTEDIPGHAKGDLISEHDLRDAGYEPPPGMSEGPGAASPGDVPGGSELKQLTSTMDASAPTGPLPARIGFLSRLKDAATDAKSAVLSTLARAQAIKDTIWNAYKGLPEYTNEQRSVGKWTYANQKADYEARQFALKIKRAVPDATRREGITNFIQADGDPAILRMRRDSSSGKLARGYDMALHLTDVEKTIARNIQQYLESQLQRGIDAGILTNGVENYVNQVWQRDNPVRQRLMADFGSGKLNPDFRFAKKRIFESYFEGEQAGYTPSTKDIGGLITMYDQAFNKAIAARAFLKDLQRSNASDGRPLVEVSGSGRIVGDVPGVPGGLSGSAILIKPRTKPGDTADYRPIDHPALRGWKWVTQATERALTDSEVQDKQRMLQQAGDNAKLKEKIESRFNAIVRGRPVLLDGEMLVHPEAWARLRNRLVNSGWRINPVGRAFLNTQSAIKQTMLAASGFHQVQETIHAAGHRIGMEAVQESVKALVHATTGKDLSFMKGLEKINFDDPVQKSLINHGLQIADYDAMQEFGEGLAGGALTNKIPWLGNKILQPYQEWLFQEYIPRLKITMALHALERNSKLYPLQALSRAGNQAAYDKVLELTAKQANAAFGELNYKYMGRNPTFQDTMRAFLLAPDFLESRAKFVGQALRPGGRGTKGIFTNEQFVALGLLAATSYITARIWNKSADDDWHWDKPFSYVYHEKEYSLRTVPGDILHMLTDSRRFWYNRISPLLGRGLIEYITGRDDRGVKRDLAEQVKDIGTSALPISFRSRDDQSHWEAFLNSFGLQNKRLSAVTQTEEAARAWKAKNNTNSKLEMIYDADKDQFRPLRMALLSGDKAAAQKAYDALKQTMPTGKIAKSMVQYYTRPYSGSNAHEAKFIQSLDQHGKETYANARTERLNNLKLFYSLKK